MTNFKQMHALTLALEVNRLKNAVEEARSILIEEPIEARGPHRSAWLKRVSDFMERTECVGSSGDACSSGLPD